MRRVNSQAEAEAAFAELGSLVDLATVQIVLGVCESRAHQLFDSGRFTQVSFFGRKMVPWQEVCRRGLERRSSWDR